MEQKKAGGSDLGHRIFGHMAILRFFVVITLSWFLIFSIEHVSSGNGDKSELNR